MLLVLYLQKSLRYLGDDRLEDAANNQEFGDACLSLSTEETQGEKEEQVSDDAAVDDVDNGKSEDDENEGGEEGEGNSSDVQCRADETATIGEANAESMHECGAQAAKKLPKPVSDLPEDFEPMTGKGGNELMAEQQVVAEIEEVVGNMVDTIFVMVSTNFLEESRIHTPEGSVLVETKTMALNGSASEMGCENVIGDAVIVDDGDEVSDLQGGKCRQGKLQDVINCIDDLGLDLDRAESFDRRVSDCPAERIDHESTARCEASMSVDVAKSEDLLFLADTSVKQTMETLLGALEHTQALEEITTCASPEAEEFQEVVEGKYCGSDTVGNARSGIPLDVVTMLDFSPGGINGDSTISDEDEVRDISECADAPANDSSESLNTTEEHARHSESSTAACRTIDELEGSTGTEALASVSEADRTDKDQVLNVVLTDENENELQISSEHDIEVESEQVLVDDADPVSGDNLVKAHATKCRSPRDYSNAPDEREADDPGTEDMLALVNDNDSPSHEVDQAQHLSSDASSLPVSAPNRLSATLISEISALEESTTLGEDEDGESDGQCESSVDSNDLMWEVDEITSFGTDVAAVSQSNSTATRSRKSSSSSRRSDRRMNSERILADLTQIEGDKASKASSHANQETCEALIERTPSVDPSIS
uniref:Uncharacterized protein n=1 Tax=Globisporangium ultimum (strain ATCC 200006 / CBS 805.95 / DAOM BR144) TaxID=431595 RepID=K3WU59_GLOUD